MGRTRLAAHFQLRTLALRSHAGSPFPLPLGAKGEPGNEATLASC